jgi:hypothetical protein
MLDPVSIGAISSALSRVMDGAMEGAGGQAWESMVKLIGHRKRHNAAALHALRDLEARPGDQASIQALAAALEQRGQADPEFARQLELWCAAILRAQGGQASGNTVSGVVHGPVVQARDIHGGINFGSDTA